MFHTTLSRGENLCESRSSIYRTNVFSSLSIRIYCVFRFSALGKQPFIWLRMIDSETLYICVARRIDNFFIVQIASIARTILASLVCVCIVLLQNCYVRKIERCVVGENIQVACICRSLMNHVSSISDIFKDIDIKVFPKSINNNIHSIIIILHSIFIIFLFLVVNLIPNYDVQIHKPNINSIYNV